MLLVAQIDDTQSWTSPRKVGAKLRVFVRLELLWTPVIQS